MMKYLDSLKKRAFLYFGCSFVPVLVYLLLPATMPLLLDSVLTFLPMNAGSLYVLPVFMALVIGTLGAGTLAIVDQVISQMLTKLKQPPKEQKPKEQQLKEQKLKEQQLKEQKLKEQQLKEQKLKEQQLKKYKRVDRSRLIARSQINPIKSEINPIKHQGMFVRGARILCFNNVNKKNNDNKTSISITNIKD